MHSHIIKMKNSTYTICNFFQDATTAAAKSLLFSVQQNPSAPAENPLSSFAAALALKHQKRSRLNRSLRTSQTLTPASAAAALAALVASLLTPDWLRTVERMPNDNRTVLWGPDKSPEYLRKLSHSGLFRLCYTEREWKNNNKQIFF